jgi:hypothetical protein
MQKFISIKHVLNILKFKGGVEFGNNKREILRRVG